MLRPHLLVEQNHPPCDSLRNERERGSGYLQSLSPQWVYLLTAPHQVPSLKRSAPDSTKLGTQPSTHGLWGHARPKLAAGVMGFHVWVSQHSTAVTKYLSETC